ncbi:MAG: radical SAM protein, partial [Geobacter sp.]|nr:radical SAM protein [Geobacter sp.]
TAAIQTNGLRWTADEVTARRERDFPGLTRQISLDGATAATHDLVRGAGAFAGALTGLKLLADGGLGQRIRLGFTEMRHNLADFPALLKLADSMGIQSVVAGSLVQSGRSVQSGRLSPPDPEQYLQLRQHLDNDQRFRELYDRIGTMAALEWGRESQARSDCCTFAEHPYLTADGRLYPCVLMHADPYSVAGVTGKSLAAAFREGAPLWAALLRESSRRAEELAVCADCPGQQFCGGGCLGRVWATTGRLCGVDDRCTVRRAIYVSTSRQNS